MSHSAHNEIRVVVLVGGPSSEAEVSRQSGQGVADALARSGFAVETIECDRAGMQKLLQQPPDCVWIAMHGAPGEDGTVQGFLELAGIPYTGTGVLGSAIALHKGLTKALVQHPDVTVLPSMTVDLDQVENTQLSDEFSFPVVVKPLSGGSSIATQIVKTADQLQSAIYDVLKVDDQALIEPFVVGREIAVGLQEQQVLGLVEVCAEDGFYGFQQKYQSDTTRYLSNPDLPDSIAQRLTRHAQWVVQTLPIEGFSRADYLVTDDGQVVFLEINTIPGMTPTSLLPKIAQANGMTFDQLVCEAVLPSEVQMFVLIRNFALFCMFALGVTVVWKQAVALTVEQVVCKGASELTEADLRVTIQQLTPEFLWMVRPSALAEQIEAHIPLDTIQVERQWPHTLQITIVERQAYATILGTQGDMVVVNRLAKPISNRLDQDLAILDRPMIQGCQLPLDRSQPDPCVLAGVGFLHWIERLEPTWVASISEIIVQQGHIEVMLHDGTSIVFGVGPYLPKFESLKSAWKLAKQKNIDVTRYILLDAHRVVIQPQNLIENRRVLRRNDEALNL